MKINIDEKRKQRYKEKISHSRERLMDLEEWLQESEKIEKRGIINSEEKKTCIEANGLRNVIIHRYNGVNEARFTERARELIPKLNEILDKLDSFIENERN